MKKIFISGGASYNSVITLDEFPQAIPQTIHNCQFDETIGNTGAGKALTLSNLGFNTVFHSLLGEDDYGEKVKSYLKVSNLHLILDIDPNGTERHLNIMNKKGERISIFINPSSDFPKIDYSKIENAIDRSTYVIINIANYCRKFLPICKKMKKQIWTDLHDYDGKNEYHQDFIDAADYIFLSSDNLPDYKPFMIQQIANGKKLVVCTHGRDGATALTIDREWIEIPIIEEYEMKNTNGAGDSFFSGFLYGYSNGYSVEKSMQFATIAAGLCIESTFITNELLDKELIEKEFLKYYANKLL